jgi:hypothetical protein
LGLFFLLVWALWSWLQARAARIVYFPEQAFLLVRTLNFTSRRIPLAALERVRYEEEKVNSETTVRIPVLTVQVRGERPIKIDLDGHILDEPMFRKLLLGRFPRKPAMKTKQRKGASSQ